MAHSASRLPSFSPSRVAVGVFSRTGATAGLSAILYFLSCLLTLSLAAPSPASAASPPENSVAVEPDARQTAAWIHDLGHSQYLRRESATRKLIEAGPPVISPLLAEIRSGELEVVERAVQIVTEIAITRPPHDDGGAWAALNELTKRTGRQVSLAISALEEIRHQRGKQAGDALAKAGIFVGADDVVIRAALETTSVIHIDERWKGDLAPLQWMRWIEDVGNVRIKGIPVTREMMQCVTAIPNLKAIIIANTKLEPESLEPLTKLNRINTLELRYVPLSDDQCEMIASIPIRGSLTLMGTGMSSTKFAEMRESLPGLTIHFRQGGFLGVRCMDGFDMCQIMEVVPGSAAEEAGLQKDDVITDIDATEVKRFKDLQDAINLHIPGDELDIRYLRGNKTRNTTVRLQHFKEL